MAKTVLGVDIGTAYIKLAWVCRTLKGSSLIASDLEPAKQSGGAGDIARQIADMVERQGVGHDSVVVAVNSEDALFQRLGFPFSQPAKIEEVLPYELESSVPATLSAFVTDFLFTGRTSGREHEVIAALYEKSRLEELVTALEEQGLPPARVDLDLAVLARISSFVLASPEESLLVLDLGWSKTNLVWRVGSRIVALRCLPGGLGDIVRELDAHIEPSSAPRIQKLLQGLSEQPDSSTAALVDLDRQVRLSLAGAESEPEPERVVLAGGGARCEAIVSFLQERFDARVAKLDATLPEGVSQTAATAVAAAAAEQKAPRRDGFDLLRGELARQEHRLMPRRQIRYLAVAVGILVVLWSGSFGLDIYLQNRKLNLLQERVRSTFHRIVPEASESVRPMQYASVIRSRIAAMDSGSVGADVPPVKATTLLSRISAALPSDLDMQTTLFALDRQTLRLSGLAKDFNTVDTIKNRLGDLDLFSQVEIVGANADRRGEGVRFNLRISLDAGS